MAYIGSSPTKVVSRQSANIFTYTATANQTAFTGSDANGNTLACTPSDIMVHMNGLRLEESDFTATTTTVTLGSGAAAGDEVTITAFVTFETADAYTKSASDTRYVNVTGGTMSGNLLLGSNSVGIGTNAPLRQLHISNTSANSEIAFTAGTSGVSSILFGDGLTGTDVYKGYLQYNHAQDKMLIATAAGSSINIDSAGRVTMPYQPAFVATGASVLTTTGDLVFPSVNQRGGTNYNTTNGRFTAPVTGFYYISFQFLASTNGERTDIVIKKNNGVLIESRNYKTSGSNYETFKCDGVVYLNVNDYVQVNMGGSSNSAIYSYATWTQFSGHLIG